VNVTNIQPFCAKCKAWLGASIGEWGLILVVFLVAVACFGLGRLSAGEAAKPVVSVSEAPVEATPKGMAVGGLVVASRNGSVYHFPWCGGAAQINEANKIWFASEESAQEAGYTPSKSCKGLGGE
jgi:hypothetical protein